MRRGRPRDGESPGQRRGRGKAGRERPEGAGGLASGTQHPAGGWDSPGAETAGEGMAHPASSWRDGVPSAPCSRSAPARAVRVPDVREGTLAQEKPPPGARGGHQDRALCRCLGAGWDSSLLAKVPVPPVMVRLAPSRGTGRGVASDLRAGAQAVPETLRCPVAAGPDTTRGREYQLPPVPVQCTCLLPVRLLSLSNTHTDTHTLLRPANAICQAGP